MAMSVTWSPVPLEFVRFSVQRPGVGLHCFWSLESVVQACGKTGAKDYIRRHMDKAWVRCYYKQDALIVTSCIHIVIVPIGLRV